MSENILDNEPDEGCFELADMPSGGIDSRYACRFVKRAFDIVSSAIVIAILPVPSLLLCIVIRIESPGSPIYRQERVGRYGKSLRIFKFRSMVADVDDVKKCFNASQLEERHKEHKVDNDPRITKVGAFIRETSIDEIPQFLNVLFGQMSIVGPRPITEEKLEWFTENEKRLLLSVPEGITGWWQVSARNEASFDSGLRHQLELWKEQRHRRKAGEPVRQDCYV